MKNFRNKVSRHFKKSPGLEEQIANTELNDPELINTHFDAGIDDRGDKKKPSRLLMRKDKKSDKPLPAPPSNASSCTVTGPDPPQSELAPSPKSTRSSGDARNLTGPDDDMPRESRYAKILSLRGKSSRFFRSSVPAEWSPPPPPSPQISVDPISTYSTSTTSPSARHSRSSIGPHRGRGVSISSISRPTLIPQNSDLSVPDIPTTVPFKKRAGPPPPRPPRPASLEADTIAFMQESATRMVLPNSYRSSNSTTDSIAPNSQTSSIVARLGLFSGTGTQPNPSFDSPPQTRVSSDTPLPLPERNSAGSDNVGRFSNARRVVDGADGELGSMEIYDPNRQGDWTVQERVCRGPNGNPGMLLRDRMGGFHFIPDI
ncbi:hypothetical protein GQ44DRAFT_707366 [Phaeosphaeriaceae sp. PMI808]|nr:hypothetical protein GQ44DRAFT_707366 [Phaeosphaeriaceae sp. PMI808]